ncbi:MAG: hypothetical protein KAI02_01330 [Gammaproteobacteria bacterium]|nr:hypothetical protein [Gammaproteobacteria bacterium]
MNKSELCQLLPHTGKMCLIDQLLSWDSTTLIAQTTSHLKQDNPLQQQDGMINSIMGIEYAAQTMALHSALLYQENYRQEQSLQKKDSGYLATIRNIQMNAEHLNPSLSDNTHPLIISVSLLMSDTQGYCYKFNITRHNMTLISGQLTLFLV